MDDVKELKQLEEVVGVDEKTLTNLISRHQNAYGISLAISVSGKIYISDGYYSEIVREYEKFSDKVIPMDELLKMKSSTIPFKNGEYVYFLFEGETLVYVGQTVNLAQRISKHLMDKVFDTVAYVEAEAGYYCLTETVNIQHYMPKYNVATSSGNGDLFAFTLKRLFA